MIFFIYFRELQENLIRSHSAGKTLPLSLSLSHIKVPVVSIFFFTGVGPPLSPERTRMLLALRINVLAKGYSGISMETLKQYIAAFNGNQTCL